MASGLISSILSGGLIKTVGEIADELFTSDEEKAQFHIKLKELELETKILEDKANDRQVKVNIEEAKHSSIYVAGWRPGAGWLCIIAMGINYILIPITAPFLAYFLTGFPVITPLNFEIMAPILFGMLGLAGARTTEKVKNVSRNNLIE